jgi:hypothetical protein
MFPTVLHIGSPPQVALQIHRLVDGAGKEEVVLQNVVAGAGVILQAAVRSVRGLNHTTTAASQPWAVGPSYTHLTVLAIVWSI